MPRKKKAATVKQAEPTITAQLIEDRYTPGLIKAMELIPTGIDRGAYRYSAAVHRRMNTILSKYDLTVSPQSVGSWIKGLNSNAKLGSGALGFSQLMNIALAVFPGKKTEEDAQISYTLLSMLLIGLWSPEKMVVNDLKEVLRAVAQGKRVIIAGDIESDIKSIKDDTEQIKKIIKNQDSETDIKEDETLAGAERLRRIFIDNGQTTEGGDVNYDKLTLVMQQNLGSDPEHYINVIKGDEPFEPGDNVVLFLLITKVIEGLEITANDVEEMFLDEITADELT